jgi:hypothetical protein
MIFPEEYKFVGIKDRECRGEQVYFATEYLISRDGPRLYHVRSRGAGFMRDVVSLEPIASGKEIVFYPDVVDTRNRTKLIELADGICRGNRDIQANTVVFKGPDEHITFVKDPDPGQIQNIEVMDVSPPDPPWLLHVLANLEACGILGDLAVRFVPRILDMRQYGSEGVYYPCRASGLGLSLDSDRVVHEHPKIVGCEVSREIFLANYPGTEFDFVNICPLHCSFEIFRPSGPFLTRCCRSERRGPTRKNGQPGMVVHWGDGPVKIAEAVRCLVQEIRK